MRSATGQFKLTNSAASRTFPPPGRTAYRQSLDKFGRAVPVDGAGNFSEAVLITNLPQQLPDLHGHGLLLVDKPVGWDTLDVVSAVQQRGRVKSCGHGGRLDINASGLVLVCCGRATHLCPQLMQLDKLYEGSFMLGASTHTYDAEGDPWEEVPWQHVSDQDLQVLAQEMQGEHKYFPPPVTVHKLSSRRVLQGAPPLEQIKPSIMDVRHASLAFTQPGVPDVSFTLHTGARGLVRPWVHEAGVRLGTRAHLTQLRRVQLGSAYLVDDAWPLEALLPLLDKYRDAKGLTRR